MEKSDQSTFWTTGIWVLLRYLATPILIAAALYILGGPQQRAKINHRLYSAVQPAYEKYLEVTGQSELLQARLHFRDPDLQDAAFVKLDELPVSATVPVVNLSNLPQSEGAARVNLNDLPTPVDDTIVFLSTQPKPPRAVATSPRPRARQVSKQAASKG